MCACGGRPGQDIGYFPLSVFVLLTWDRRHGLSLKQKLNVLGWMFSYRATRIYRSLSSNVEIIAHAIISGSLKMWIVKIWTQVLHVLGNKQIYPLSLTHLPLATRFLSVECPWTIAMLVMYIYLPTFTQHCRGKWLSQRLDGSQSRKYYSSDFYRKSQLAFAVQLCVLTQDFTVRWQLEAGEQKWKRKADWTQLLRT